MTSIAPPIRDATPEAAPAGHPSVPESTIVEATPNEDPSARAQQLSLIRDLGHLLDDLERARIANGNRIGALEREHGDAIPELYVIQEGLRHVEHIAELQLKRAWRKHPLAAWAKTVPGLGEKQAARLIATIGEPGDRPNPAKLRAYCGYGDPRRRRRAGMGEEEARKLGNSDAKKRAYLIGAQFVRTLDSPYRALYDQARERYAERGWTPGHEHQAAIRFVVKRFLVDLWREARRA